MSRCMRSSFFYLLSHYVCWYFCPFFCFLSLSGFSFFYQVPSASARSSEVGYLESYSVLPVYLALHFCHLVLLQIPVQVCVLSAIEQRSSVAKWLKRRAYDQHGLGSTRALLFVLLGKTLYGTFGTLLGGPGKQF